MTPRAFSALSPSASATSEAAPPFPAGPVPFKAANLLHGLVPWLFLITGPYLIILHAGQSIGLPREVLTSWFMAGPIAGGLITILLSVLYRVPVCSSLTAPGSLLALSTLAHIPFSEAVGAFAMTGLAVALIAVSGLAERLVSYLPLPIVFAMVAGVFAPYVVGIPLAFQQSPWLVGFTFLVFVLSTKFRSRLGGIPPTFFAAVMGILWAGGLGQVDWTQFPLELAKPVFTSPQFTWRGLISLTLPLSLMVVGVHGTQSAGITRGCGLPYATRAYTLTVGAASIPVAFLGSSPLCILGPPTAMLLSGVKNGQDDGRWAGAVMLGGLLILFGLFSPVLAGIPHWLPRPLVACIAGLAILNITGNYLSQAFSGRFTFGALLAFAVTFSGVSFFHIGSPLWGLLAGLITSWILEPQDFKKEAPSSAAAAGPGAGPGAEAR